MQVVKGYWDIIAPPILIPRINVYEDYCCPPSIFSLLIRAETARIDLESTISSGEGNSNGHRFSSLSDFFLGGYGFQLLTAATASGSFIF